MKSLGGIAVFVAVLGWGAIGSATITDWDVHDDGDGAVVCNSWTWGSDTMWIYGDQYWGPGHIGTLPLSNKAFFQTDTELDPTVTMENAIDNDTGFDWTGYHVNIYMNKSFTVTVPTIYGGTTEPGWSGSVTVSPAAWDGSEYKAQVDFVGGTPIPDGGTLDFGYKMSFTGSVQYCQEMIPIPEPGTLILVLTGLVGLVAVRRFVRR